MVKLKMSTRMNFLLLCFYLSALSFLPAPICCRASSCGVSMVVVGSTGDLARRYIWPAVFQQYQTTECTTSGPSFSLPAGRCGLVVVGCTRESVSGNSSEWWQQLLTGVHCKSISCELCLKKFVRSSIRYELGTDVDHYFENLTTVLTGAHDLKGYMEVGRVFYLSVPSSAYLRIVQNIHKHGRIHHFMAWLRVVLEKPFGMDLASAQVLTKELAEYLEHYETYLVDHYLGKLGVRNILPFRSENADILGRLWNREHVQYVEVCVKEYLDVKGRSSFFDKYGIIRDMHQSHLMEILMRVMLDTSVLNKTNFLQEKTKFLDSLYPPNLENTILGQYKDYFNHLVADGVQWKDSSAPTFATVLLHSHDRTWTRVPLLLTAGKQLGERKAYARVVFRQMTFSLTKDEQFCPAEIIFLIQDNEFNVPGFLCSLHFADLRMKNGIYKRVQRGGCPYMFVHLHCDSTCSNAYISLIADVIVNKREKFVDSVSLLKSWRVWDPLLREMRQIQATSFIQYSPDNISLLDFRVEGTKLVPVYSAKVPTSDPCMDGSRLIRGFLTVVGHKDQIAACLRKRIVEDASIAVHDSGVFHLALPGGESPKLVLDLLSQDDAHAFPWKYTHIWQTDERCVPQNHTFSNWNQLHNMLLSHIAIPYHQLHPMPVHLHSGMCVVRDNGFNLYAKQLWENTGTGQLDHVVLGVGRDGHIASLFPAIKIVQVNSSRCSKVQLVQLHATDKRMTLTFDMLLSAKTISVLISGEGKEGVVKALLVENNKQFDRGVDDIPIMGLLKKAASENIQVHIYIDNIHTRTQKLDFFVV